MPAPISVIVPVYNGARYLAECLESIFSQTVSPFEVVLVDDGSEDETPDIARRFGDRIVYVRKANGGLASARNAGLRVTRAEFIAMLDADDLWLPQKLELQLNALRDTPAAAMAFGHIVQFVSDELTDDERSVLKFDPTPSPGWMGSTMLTRMTDMRRVGDFDISLKVGEFVEWLGRARVMGVQSIMLPEVVCRRRLHRTNMGRTQKHARGDYARALKMVLDRRRTNS